MRSPDDSHDRIEELLARADRVVHQQLPPRRERRALPMVLIGIGAIVAIIVAVSLVSGRDSGPSGSAQTTAVPLASTTTDISTTSPIVITLPPNSTTATTPTTDAAATTTIPADAVSGQPVRWITYGNGTITLLGAVPDQATADTITAKMEGAFGAANVSNQYTVTAGAALPDGDLLYAQDFVQFGPSSFALDTKAMQFLDLIVRLMAQRPEITMDINAYADGTGTPDAAKALSQTRADIVFGYLMFNGVSASRLTHNGLGATDPVADDSTPEGQALNRRVEFVLHHLAD